MNTQFLDLDLHRLDLRFAGARMAEPRAVERIARSIERGGQIVPCIAVADPPVEVLEGGERLVLIDGYRRIAALRRLGRDTARVEAGPGEGLSDVSIVNCLDAVRCGLHGFCTESGLGSLDRTDFRWSFLEPADDRPWRGVSGGHDLWREPAIWD